MRTLSLLGAGRDAVRLAPIAEAIALSRSGQSLICATNEEPESLSEALRLYGLTPQLEIPSGGAGETREMIFGRILEGAREAVDRARPDWLIVEGDGITALAGALAGAYAGVPVAHVGAGVRGEGDAQDDAPRRAIAQLAKLHFAAESAHVDTLLSEGLVEDAIEIVGDPVIDALDAISFRLEQDDALRAEAAEVIDALELSTKSRLVLIAGQSRPHGLGTLDRAFGALARLARRGELEVLALAPLHPSVLSAADRAFAGMKGARLLDPLPWLTTVALMRRAALVIADSPRAAQESAALGTPVLLLTPQEPQPEQEAPTARRRRSDGAEFLRELKRLPVSQHARAAMARPHRPAGDGRAGDRVAHILAERCAPRLRRAS